MLGCISLCCCCCCWCRGGLDEEEYEVEEVWDGTQWRIVKKTVYQKGSPSQNAMLQKATARFSQCRTKNMYDFTRLYVSFKWSNWEDRVYPQGFQNYPPRDQPIEKIKEFFSPWSFQRKIWNLSVYVAKNIVWVSQW